MDGMPPPPTRRLGAWKQARGQGARAAWPRGLFADLLTPTCHKWGHPRIPPQARPRWPGRGIRRAQHLCALPWEAAWTPQHALRRPQAQARNPPCQQQLPSRQTQDLPGFRGSNRARGRRVGFAGPSPGRVRTQPPCWAGHRQSALRRGPGPALVSGGAHIPWGALTSVGGSELGKPQANKRRAGCPGRKLPDLAPHGVPPTSARTWFGNTPHSGPPRARGRPRKGPQWAGAHTMLSPRPATRKGSPLPDWGTGHRELALSRALTRSRLSRVLPRDGPASFTTRNGAPHRAGPPDGDGPTRPARGLCTRVETCPS